MIAIVTEWTLANGGGHYKRMSALFTEAKRQRGGRDARIFVFTDLPEAALPQAFGDPFPKGVIPGRNLTDLEMFLSSLPQKTPVCVDLRRPDTDLVRLLSSSGRRIFYYDRTVPPAKGRGILLDLAGSGPRLTAGNGFERWFETGCVLADGRFGRLKSSRTDLVLITFGSTDPFGLTRRIIPALEKLTDERFILVLPLTWDGPDPFPKDGHVRCVRFGNDLFPLLKSAGVVVTAFGTTMWESLSAGRRIFLVDPTPYHRSVSALVRGRGVPGIPGSAISAPRLREGLGQARAMTDQQIGAFRSGVTGGASRLLVVLGSEGMKSAPGSCPVCGSRRMFRLSVSSDSALFRCANCRSNIRLGQAARSSYDAKYFKSAYASQYGRTYVQDRPTMDVFNRERIAHLRKLLRRVEHPSVMDLGCALGFFLDSARKEGFETEGLELIPQAAEYARKKLKLKVSRSDISSFKPTRTYDSVTLWYVLEHLPDPGAIIAKAARLVRKGGVLGVSVPHSSGFSFLFNRPLWLFQRPADHHVDFSLKGLDRLGRRYGFRRVRKVWRGIHLERLKTAFPLFSRLPETPFFRSLFLKICRFLGIGDTLEVYFRKVT
jgi:SAM-dependent methyltransferase